MLRQATYFIISILVLGLVLQANGSIVQLEFDYAEIAIGISDGNSQVKFSMLDNFSLSPYNSILASRPEDNIVYITADSLSFIMVNGTIGRLFTKNNSVSFTDVPSNNILMQFQKNGAQDYLGSWDGKLLFIDLPGYIEVFDSGIMTLSSIDILMNQSSTIEYNLTQILQSESHFPKNRLPRSEDGIIKSYSLDFHESGVYNNTIIITFELNTHVLGIDGYDFVERLFFVYIDLDTGQKETISVPSPSDHMEDYYPIFLGKDLKSMIYILAESSDHYQPGYKNLLYLEIPSAISKEILINSSTNINYYDLTSGKLMYRLMTESKINLLDFHTNITTQLDLNFGVPHEEYHDGQIFLVDEYFIFIGYDYVYTEIYPEGGDIHTSSLPFSVQCILLITPLFTRNFRRSKF